MKQLILFIIILNLNYKLYSKFNKCFFYKQVIDCRYPYEFEGGHIVGAQNLYTEDQVNERLLAPSSTINIKSSPTKSIIVFHCEFSLQRGPML